MLLRAFLFLSLFTATGRILLKGDNITLLQNLTPPAPKPQ
jgi:hypothetical protein